MRLDDSPIDGLPALSGAHLLDPEALTRAATDVASSLARTTRVRQTLLHSVVSYHDNVTGRVEGALGKSGSGGHGKFQNLTNRPYRPGQSVMVEYREPRGAYIRGAVDADEPMARIQKSTTQNIAERTVSPVVFNLANSDNWGMWNGATALWLPISGRWALSASINLQSEFADATIKCDIWANGTTILASDGAFSNMAKDQGRSCSTEVWLAEGTYVECMCFIDGNTASPPYVLIPNGAGNHLSAKWTSP